MGNLGAITTGFLLLLTPLAFADGMKPYTPKLGEWVEHELNTTHKILTSRYATSFVFRAPNTMGLIFNYDPSLPAGDMDDAIASATKAIKEAASRRGWKNVVVDVVKSRVGK